MESFLGSGAFSASDTDAGDFPGPFLASALFHGAVGLAAWPRDRLAALLPPSLELARGYGPDSALHPVALIFGEQTESHAIFAGRSLRTGARYPELGIMLPFIRRSGCTDLHIFVPRMYASYPPIVWSGEHVYGYGKRLARMHWQHGRLRVESPEGVPLLEACVESDASWRRATGSQPTPGHETELDALRRIFRLPVLGRRPGGRYVVSHFHWGFGAARVRPARATLTLYREILPGIPTGRFPTIPSATVQLDSMLWRLSWPEL